MSDYIIIDRKLLTSISIVPLENGYLVTVEHTARDIGPKKYLASTLAEVGTIVEHFYGC